MAKRETLLQKIKSIEQADFHTADITLRYALSHINKRVNTREQKVLIAAALNELVHKKKLVILGYLINTGEIYLVPECYRKDVSAVQKLIADALKKIIRWDNITNEVMLMDDQLINLYTVRISCIILEDALVYSLLTGGRLKMPFNEYRYVKLQKQIQTEEFSSAIDYNGGISPVIVKCKDR